MNCEQLCRLCMSTNTVDHLNIFSDIGKEMKMNEIISEHFKCEVSELDQLPNFVCKLCWKITDVFHKLYQTSKIIQEKFRNPTIKIEPDARQPWHNHHEIQFVDGLQLELGVVKTETNLEDVDLVTDTNVTEPDLVPDTIDSFETDYDDSPNDSDDGKSNNMESNHKKRKKNVSKCSETLASTGEKKKKSRRAMRISKQERDKKFDAFLIEHKDLLKMDCDLCPEIFTNLHDARKHYATKHNTPNGYIKCCNAKFTYPSQVIDHVKRHLKPKSKLKIKWKKRLEKTFSCDLCAKSFARKTYMESHMKWHVEKNEKEDEVQMKFIQENFDMKCDFCDAVFRHFYDARRHYKDFHNDDKGYLKCCNMKLRELWMIKDHIKSHIDPDSFKCNTCGKCFTNKNWLTKHKIRHKLTMEKSFICDYCGKRCRDKEQILRHMFTKHVFVEAKHECEICHKKFQLPILLKNHVYATHRVKKRVATCDICGKSFFTNFHLEKHKLLHLDKSERLVDKKQCEHCGEWLLTKSGVFYHQQIHTSGIHKCEQCKLEFPNRVAYLTHVRHYHRAHKFKCSFCGKTFPIKSTLQKHEESHTRHKVYPCQFCSKTFTVPSSLSTHMSRDHKEERERLREMRKLNRISVPEKDQ